MTSTKALCTVILGCFIATGCDDGGNDEEKTTPENTEALCGDEADNDGDGKVDCDDNDCASFCKADEFTIEVTNELDAERVDAPIMVSVADITDKYEDFNPEGFTVFEGDKEISSQPADVDGDGTFDTLVLVSDFDANETKELTVTFDAENPVDHEYPVRTQAVLSIKEGGQWNGDIYEGGTWVDVDSVQAPEGLPDHTQYIRFEGPGWESDRIAYRIYLDKRNAVDVTGKKVTDMVLQDMGLDGYDSYHSMSDWGMDIMNVEQAMGLGSIGSWTGMVKKIQSTESTTAEKVDNGPLYSHVRIVYDQWSSAPGGTIDLISNLSIAAGGRMTEHRVTVDGDIENLCTTLMKYEEGPLLSSPEKTGGWTYLATYGNQSYIGDAIGLAILYKVEDLLEITEDALNHVIVMTPTKGNLTYYFLAAWEQEPDGITTEEEFATYLDTTVAELDSPIVATIK